MPTVTQNHTPRPFIKVDVEVFQALNSCPPSWLRVYLHLTFRAGTDSACWESVENMAKATGLSTRTLKLSLAGLLDLGLISRASRAGHSSNYRITPAESVDFEAVRGKKLPSDKPNLGKKVTQVPGLESYPGGGLESYPQTRSQELDPKELDQNSGGDLTRTSQDHDDDFFTELQPIAQAPLPPEPQAPKPEPQIIPSVNSIQDLQGQGEAPPVPQPPPKVPPRNPSLAPNPTARVGNGTPWAPLAPWTSREEYDAFKAWLVAANPGKPEGYIHAILIRVEKGDFDNRSWQGFKAGSSPDNTPAGTNTPKEWQDAVQAIFDGLGSNPFYATREADRWAESYQQFRRLYSYDSKGQPVRWPAADSWALAQAKAILAAAYPAAS